MRCKGCGSILHHLVTTADGQELRQCGGSLTVNGATDSATPGVRNVIGLRQCGLVYKLNGKLASGKYVYQTYHGEKLVPEALTVRGGIIVS